MNRFILTPYFLDEPLHQLESLAASSWYMNTPKLPNGNLQTRLSALHEPLAVFTQQALAEGLRPVSIAGDCVSALGVLAGVQRAGLNPLLIWFDAHGDFNTWQTSPSGFLGGMPLAMLAGRGEQTMVEALGLAPLAEDRVILTDARDLDPLENQALEKAGVNHLVDVGLLHDYPFGDTPLVIHLDMDIVDPSEVPANNYPAPGGPSAQDVEKVLLHLKNTQTIAAVSMSTWSPLLDSDQRSAKVCMRLLHALIDDRQQ